jgi:hypothetical protein
MLAVNPPRRSPELPPTQRRESSSAARSGRLSRRASCSTASRWRSSRGNAFAYKAEATLPGVEFRALNAAALFLRPVGSWRRRAVKSRPGACTTSREWSPSAPRG